MFRNVFSERKRFFCNHGNPEKDLFALGYDEDGCQCLKKVGKTNIYNEIQSHRDSCDLHQILSKLDPSQVNAMMSSYTYDDLLKSSVINMATMPKNPGEMLNMMKEAENLFNGLPVDLREAFNFSPEKFFSEIGTKSFETKIELLNAQRMPKTASSTNTTEPQTNSGGDE